MNAYKKNFDVWNKRKKRLDNRFVQVHAYPREVWWCSLGLNVGTETDGKHKDFERPVIVMKIYNKESMVILPLTSVRKNDLFHFRITVEDIGITSWVKLSQTRTISPKRLLRKVGYVKESQFNKLKQAWLESL